MTRRPLNTPPAFYTQWRAPGGPWSAPCPFEVRPTPAEARARAAHNTRYELDGLVKGRMADWRLVCNGIVVLAWQEDGRE